MSTNKTTCVDVIPAKIVLRLAGRVDLEKLDLARRTLLAAEFQAEAEACSEAMLSLACLEAIAVGRGDIMEAMRVLGRAIREELGRLPGDRSGLRLTGEGGGDG